ncbi:hypothetical protein [Pseudolabrys sp. FHR47]|uniref:hypothetical protein n=1 Tax=Pseudolabrys sp. FHR47 TaxID=2562284 RepID=UPI0010BF0F27|nr:hypothetical protein [Pseudolabrys sp. FHR47]
MKVYVFNSTISSKVYGFTGDASGANLPTEQGPWKPFKSLEMNPGETARVGVNTDAVLMGIHDKGYYLTAAEIKFEGG